MAIESETLNGWTMSHDTTFGGYTLECKDNNFDAQTKTITINCDNKAMDGNVEVTVKAKTGNIGLTNTFSGSASSTQLNGTTITLSKVFNNDALNFSSGWINSKPSVNANISLASNVPTEAPTKKPKESYEIYTHSDGKLISSIGVSPTYFSDWKFGYNLIQWHRNAKSDNNYIKLNRINYVFICLTDGCKLNDGAHDISIGGGAIVYCEISRSQSTGHIVYNWYLTNYDGTSTLLQTGSHETHADSFLDFDFTKSNNADHYYGIIAIQEPYYNG